MRGWSSLIAILGFVGVTAFGIARVALPLGLAASASGCGEDCIERTVNCSQSYKEANGLEGVSCCEGLTCCAVRLGSGIPTCNPVANCD